MFQIHSTNSPLYSFHSVSYQLASLQTNKTNQKHLRSHLKLRIPEKLHLLVQSRRRYQRDNIRFTLQLQVQVIFQRICLHMQSYTLSTHAVSSSGNICESPERKCKQKMLLQPVFTNSRRSGGRKKALLRDLSTKKKNISFLVVCIASVSLGLQNSISHWKKYFKNSSHTRVGRSILKPIKFKQLLIKYRKFQSSPLIHMSAFHSLNREYVASYPQHMHALAVPTSNILMWPHFNLSHR